MRRCHRVEFPFLWAFSCALLVLAAPSSARAAFLGGDLNGDGSVDAADESLLEGLYGSAAGDANYDPVADLNVDGAIDVRDLAIFAVVFGAAGGSVDTTPPGLLVTLNDIPDHMNDLLVVPPDAFQITVAFDAGGESAIDAASLVVTSDQDVGALAAGTDLAGQFSVTPTRAVWEIPAGSDLARTSHYLDVSIRDAAGNQALENYGFAVRDFSFGPPLGNPQTLFLDFGQDRSLGPEIDFIEDLREYGLSTPAVPALESTMRDRLVSEIVARVHSYYDRNPDGSPGADAANIVFVASQPGGNWSRLCVGGESSLGAQFLGAELLDVNNLDEASSHCGGNGKFGVFPQAMDNLWGSDANFQAAFDALDPDRGGVPVGDDPLDVVVTAPGFDPAGATLEEITRYAQIEVGVEAFAQAIATAAAHETGHLLGLTAPGAAPAGLFGGTSGGSAEHNLNPTGNFLMNFGGSFSFAEMTGASGVPLPVFRPLNWAYLRDRVALNVQVTGLFPAPTLSGVTPNPAVYGSPAAPVQITVSGANFLESPVVPTVLLITAGDPTANLVTQIQFVDANTLTGTVHPALVQPALYDVRLVNSDGQEVILVEGLEVQ